MPWQWDGRGQKAVDVGGSRGTTTEAATSVTWPNYQAAYLATRLGGGEDARDIAYVDKYKAGLKVPSEAQAAYFDKVTANYKAEADECLKREFNDWLQGNHELNDPDRAYPNLPGQMQRKWVFRDRTGWRDAPGGGVAEFVDGKPKAGIPSEKLEQWHPTWWGRGSLTFLPGVRDYLRDQATGAAEHEYMMNLLAEFGPQNIDQAWMYFKHWVKGRPLTETTCLHGHQPYEGPVSTAVGDLPSTRAPLGPIQPDTFHNKYEHGYEYKMDKLGIDLAKIGVNGLPDGGDPFVLNDEPPSDAGTQTDPLPPVQQFITNNYFPPNAPDNSKDGRPKIAHTPQAGGPSWGGWLGSKVGSGVGTVAGGALSLGVAAGGAFGRAAFRNAPSYRDLVGPAADSQNDPNPELEPLVPPAGDIEAPPVKVEPPAVKVEQDDDNVYDVQREFVVKTEQETERAEQLEEFYSADPGPSDYRRRYTRGGSEF
ncbi:MAG: hypothetical protein CMJ58_09140 [Planctomycetaceae bacterium]|jgi:hypothetical protein|nr:hypothetical protein [Planctomycetaceae bacterium]